MEEIGGKNRVTGGFHTPTQGSRDRSKEVSSRHKNYSNDTFKNRHTQTPSSPHPPQKTFDVSTRRDGQQGDAIENAAALAEWRLSSPCLSKCSELSPALRCHFLKRKKSDFLKVG